MRYSYNMNQMTLELTTTYVPDSSNVAHYINNLVEQLKIESPHTFGRPREYDYGMMLKLLLFAYTRNVFSSRRIEQFAQENLPARWLTQEHFPSYRTIARFRVSEEAEQLIEQAMDKLVVFLRIHHLIDDTLFIDGTKLLADANKYSFVWKKNTIRYASLNKARIETLLSEMKTAYSNGLIPDTQEVSLEYLEEVITRLELQLEELKQEHDDIDTPTDTKKQLKFKKRQLQKQAKNLRERTEKAKKYDIQRDILKDRNSYSKTDHAATFMRVKEDHMKNGQLKPAYNLQLATCNQFIIGCQLFQNPADMRTLPTFIDHLNLDKHKQFTIVADSGYGSESNYFYLKQQDNLTALIPYGMMAKEHSRKWKKDPTKMINWTYNAKEDSYTDWNGVKFLYDKQVERVDRHQFKRTFKQYVAQPINVNGDVMSEALTPRGHFRKIHVNVNWEMYKQEQKQLLSEYSDVYSRRKTDVESVFGKMKASLGFNRLHLRGLRKATIEVNIVSLAINFLKLRSLGQLVGG